MIKAIIFDLWETLGTKNVGISKTLMNHFNIEKSPDFMVKYESSIQLNRWKNEHDMSSSFLKHFKLPMTEENLTFVEKTLFSGIENATLFKDMDNLLVDLKKSYKLGILSNTTVFESEVLKRWNIHELFDTQVYSWQINSLKPSKMNYDEICSRLKLHPSECVFIDDSEKNVASAKNLGFIAIKYENISQLCNELNNVGVILHDKYHNF